MEKETGILSLKGKFVKGDVVNMDFKEPKGFVTEIRKPYAPKEWQERRKALLKVKLP